MARVAQKPAHPDRLRITDQMKRGVVLVAAVVDEIGDREGKNTRHLADRAVANHVADLDVRLAPTKFSTVGEGYVPVRTGFEDSVSFFKGRDERLVADYSLGASLDRGNDLVGVISLSRREAEDVWLHLVQHSVVVAVRDNVPPDVFPGRAKLLPGLLSGVVGCNDLHLLDGREDRASVVTTRCRLKAPVHSGESHSEFFGQGSVPVSAADQSILSSK